MSETISDLISIILVYGFFGAFFYGGCLLLKKMPVPKHENPHPKPDNLDTIKQAINRAEHDDASFLYCFGNAIGLAFKNYFNFNGRSTREQFWYFALFAFLAMFVAGSVQEIYYYNTSQLSHPIPVVAILTSNGPIPITTGLIILIPYFSVAIRRLHDIGKSGWWILLTFTGIGNILLIIWWATKSAPGQKYRSQISEKSNEETSSASKLRELNQLYKEGVLTKEEFAEAKKKYL